MLLATFKMADGRTDFMLLLLRSFSSLTACHGINLALLNVQADYVKRRLNIIKDEDKNHLQDFGLDRNVKVLGGETLLPN